LDYWLLQAASPLPHCCYYSYKVYFPKDFEEICWSALHSQPA